VHNLLFLLPSLADRAQPKCKSHAARAAAYDLLVETVKGSVENYRLLHNWVMSQHMQGEDSGTPNFHIRTFGKECSEIYTQYLEKLFIKIECIIIIMMITQH